MAEVDLRNRQLLHKLDKEKRENLKLSGEFRKQSVSSASPNPDPNARRALPPLTRDNGTIPKFSLGGSNDQMDQSRVDRVVRKSRLQPDLSYVF